MTNPTTACTSEATSYGREAHVQSGLIVVYLTSGRSAILRNDAKPSCCRNSANSVNIHLGTINALTRGKCTIVSTHTNTK